MEQPESNHAAPQIRDLDRLKAEALQAALRENRKKIRENGWS